MYKREVRSDGAPLVYYRLGQRNEDNPVDSGDTNTSPSLVITYKWGVSGALGDEPTDRAIFLTPTGRVNFTRQSMTGDQSRLCWVRTTSTDASSAYAGDPAMPVFGDTSASVWDGFGVHAGKVQFNRFNNSTWQTFASAKSVNDGRWHHIAVTYNSTTRAVLLYVDGVQDGSGTVSAHQAQGGVNALGKGFGADYFEGSIDEAEAWASVLPAHRILARYQVGRRCLAGLRLGRVA